jgi:REP element-mobilizing transposase RayT
MADAIREVITRCRYTCWSCAILSNHVHLLIRRHRDDANTMWDEFAHAIAQVLRRFEDVGPNHPVWSDRPYKVFLYTPHEVEGRIGYIRRNPEKENLPRQEWSFVLPYNGWPLHNARR